MLKWGGKILGKIQRIPYKGKELLSAKTDLVFKALLTADGDFELLASLLSCILELDLHADDISIANTELSRTHEQGKLANVDVRVRLADGKHINAEIQVNNEHNIEKRSIFYVSRLYIDQMGPRMKFNEICPAIAINILDYIFLPFTEYHNRYRLRNTTNNHELTDVFEVNFLELPKVPDAGCRSLKDLWMQFLAADSEETLEMLKAWDPIFRRAVEKLTYFSADEQLRYDLDMREKWELDHYSAMATRLERAEKESRELGMKQGIEQGIERGMKQGIERGMKQGIEQGLKRTACRMIKEGIDISLIVKMTDLPAETVMQLKTEQE